jgi:thiosulfate dehydrogenase (quinone) large subunit
MVLDFLESIKYVGHLWPIALLRFFIGFQYFRMASDHFKSGLLEHPFLAEQLRLKMENVDVLGGYFSLWNSFMQENWFIASYVVIISELVIGVSYIFGYLVRPVALWAAFLSLHLFWLVEAKGDMTLLFAFSIHTTFCLLGAGRCLGVDYYFYKSRRGLLW